MVTLVWCMKFTARRSRVVWTMERAVILFRADLRETRECAVHTSHRRHTHMLMHASYDVNAISRKGALPIWIGGSLFMALFSPVSHSLYKFECGPVHPLTSQHLNTADTNNHDPLDRRAGARS